MRFGIRRFVIGAFAASGLLLVHSAAYAQSEASLTTRVNFNANSVLTSTSVEPTFAVTPFTPKLKASFQQPQLGPTQEDTGIGFGALIMATRASFTTDIDGLDSDARSGLGFGLWVGGNRNGRVGFTGEFIFLSRKGNVTDEEGNVETATLRVLEIPAVFHINFGSRSRNSVGGYGVIGPAVSFKLNESFTGGFGEDNFGGVDVGILVGAGVEIMRFGFEVRVNIGVKDISAEGTVGDVHTRTWEFLGKFAFN